MGGETLKEAADEIDRLRAELAELRPYCETLNRRLMETGDELKRLRAENAELLDALGNAELQDERLRAENERLRVSWNEDGPKLMKDNERLQADYKELRDTYDKCVAERDRLRAELESFEQARRRPPSDFDLQGF